MSENAATRFYETSSLRNITGETLRPGGLETTRRALEFCDFSPGCAILDIGCGTGITQRMLCEYGYQTYGIDTSSILLNSFPSDACHTIQACGESVPIAGQLFDGIFLECTLSVTRLPETVLTEINRILKPGGLLILSDLYARNAFGIPPLRAALLNQCFNFIWSQAEITRMVQTTGMDIVLWEDHSESIRKFAGKAILNYGSMGTFWNNQFAASGNRQIDPLNFQLLLSRARVGYFLLIAHKTDS